MFGGIIGGMSALDNNKSVKKTKYYFIINYWDMNSKEPNSIFVSDNVSNKEFIRINNERILNI